MNKQTFERRNVRLVFHSGNYFYGGTDLFQQDFWLKSEFRNIQAFEKKERKKTQP